MASLSIRDVYKTYPNGVPVLKGVNIDIEDGQFLILVGGSGCGKSTLLNMIAGLETVTKGEIQIDGKTVNNLSPKDRDIAMVFQSYALYPSMTVRENISFGLNIRKVPKQEQAQIVDRVSNTLQITHLLDRKPGQLSGGQRQRVAMGRALARDPVMFLFDEPLSNLDAKLRVQTRAQIASLTRRLGVTTVYVTHDQVEAMTMGDRVAVLDNGRLQQVDTPANLYDRPANLFVAGFMGSPAMNLLEAPVEESSLRLGDVDLELTESQRGQLTGTTVTVGIRPEDLRTGAEHGLEITVDLVEELGADAYVHGRARLRGGERSLVARVGGRSTIRRGDTVRVAPDTARLHLFDTESGLRLEADERRAA